MKRPLFAVLMCTLAAISVQPAAAADPAGTVSSTGSAKLELPPALLRIKVDLSASGKDIGGALAKLKDLRQAADDQVRALGARPDSIHFSPPTTGKGNDPARQMQAMIQQRLRGRGKKVAAATTVSVSTTLSAEWPLAGGNPDERLIAAAALCEKIKAADLAGVKSAKAQSAEDEELAEESAGMAQTFSGQMGENQPQPGMPSFAFVARLSDQQRAKLLAEAFDDARQQAGRLASAAGTQLGPLMQLSANTAADENPYARAWAAYGMVQGQNIEHAASEAVGTEPGQLVYQVLVQASFGLKR
ncbi:MAG TPA: SIMPL domain-containing protein [Pirellulales bacterium]